ncbi:MAG TPA: hypothetical protein D7I05_07900, partial [Candidatus Poseidoniales archaeon]
MGVFSIHAQRNAEESSTIGALKSGGPSWPIMHLCFVCVGNSCRSQMAEAIARSMGY